MRTKYAYWDPDSEIINLLDKPPEDMTKKELEVLVKELDRRFMQLWDKVVFERENNLVKYELLRIA